MAKRALVASYSDIAHDPRVLRQIHWLTSESYEVTTIGLGENPSTINKTHFRLEKRTLLFRLMTYVVFWKGFRYWLLIEQPNRLLKQSLHELGGFDLIVFNDIDLLPLAMKFKNDPQISRNETRFHLDLHEYFPNHGLGLIWKTLFKKYGNWLQSQLPTQLWDSVSTVAPSIAKLYEQSQIFREVSYVLSAPRLEEMSATECTKERIDLIYHGVADLSRGLVQLIDLVQQLDNRFHLNFMLVGSKRNITLLMKKAKRTAERIHFLDAVETNKIALAINQFDIEVIFYLPHTLNLLNALPNKYFEAVQAKLAILHGPSPSMLDLSAQYDNGIFIDNWSYIALAEKLNSLTVDEINLCKLNSIKASRELSSYNEGLRFVKIVEGR